MPWILLHQITYFGQLTPKSIKNRCLEYHYTKTFCEARVNLEVCSYLANEHLFANGSPGELRIVALNTATPNNLLWPMDPPSESRIYAWNTATPKKLFWLMDHPQHWIKNRCLEYCYTKTFCEARVNLEVCSYLADEPSLANGPLKWIKNRCLEYCYTKEPTLANGPTIKRA